MQDTRKRLDNIRKKLRKMYPHVKTQLEHRNPFELLVATILSAQCTDRQVNMVSRKLFNGLKTPKDFVEVDTRELEGLIRSTGYFRNKTKNIKACAAALEDNFDGEVPGTLDELVTLPGVGRKTANVVLGAAFGIPGIVVDTHVSRISRRLGLTTQKDPVKIEFDLMDLVPKRAWNDFSLHLIYFGREYCTARKPRCPECPIRRQCPYPDKTK